MHIDLPGLITAKATFVEEQWFYLNHSLGDKGSSPKMNVIARLMLQFAHYNVATRHISLETPPPIVSELLLCAWYKYESSPTTTICWSTGSLMWEESCVVPKLSEWNWHLQDCIPPSPLPLELGNGPGDLGSIPGRVIPKTLKMELDTTLLNTQHYKVRFKGKVEQSWEWSSTLPYTLV